MLSPSSQRQLYPQFSEETLFVITPISNPKRYESRYRLYREFAEYVNAQPNTELITVELTFGDRDFALKDVKNHIGVRCDSELWHKENLINIGASRLPTNWKYMAWIDADVKFARNDWAMETLHLLQHYSVVQMFSQATDLGPNHEGFFNADGFVCSMEKYGVYRGPYSGKYGLTFHPGYAWAIRREAFDGVGGLIDSAICGAGDHHMALALYGKAKVSIPAKLKESPAYAEPILLWQERAERVIQRNVGYVPGQLLHYWHGKKKDRRYKERWQILADHSFDPRRDVVRDHQGLLRLAGTKPALRDDLRSYFSARNEDSIDL